MFGRKKIKELEAEVRELKERNNAYAKRICSVVTENLYLTDHFRKVSAMVKFICIEANITPERFIELKKEYKIDC